MSRVAAAWAFVISLSIITREAVAPAFAYAGYTPRASGPDELVVAAVLTTLLGASLPSQITRPSQFAYTFLVITVAMPILWTAKDYGPLPPSGYLYSASAVAIGFCILRAASTAPAQPTPLFRVSPAGYWTALVGLTALGFGLLLATGLRPNINVLSDVYGQRADYMDAAGSAGSYASGMLVNAVLPMFVVVGMHRRRRAVVVLGTAGYLLALGFTGQKSYLVGLILTLLAIPLLRRGRGIGTSWTIAMTGTLWLGLLVDVLTATVNGTSLLVRRAVTTTGLNTADYVDYFSQSPTYQLRHSILAPLGPPPSPLPPARAIGSAYYGSSAMAANANFLADGFANFGFLGAIGAAVVLALYLRSYDRVAAHLPVAVSASALVTVLIAASNTAVLTMLLTHGGIALLATVGALPSPAPARLRARAASAVTQARATVRTARP